MDVTEAEDIKKRQQEYTEELYKKDLKDPDNYNGVITHLEPDILECELKWAFGSISTNKTSIFFIMLTPAFFFCGFKFLVSFNRSRLLKRERLEICSRQFCLKGINS